LLKRYRLLVDQPHHSVVDVGNHYLNRVIARIEKRGQRPGRRRLDCNSWTAKPGRKSGHEKECCQRPRQYLQPGFQTETGGRRFRNGFVPSLTEKGGVCPFRNLDEDRFAAAFSVEVLMQLEAQLPDMHAD